MRGDNRRCVNEVERGGVGNSDISISFLNATTCDTELLSSQRRTPMTSRALYELEDWKIHFS